MKQKDYAKPVTNETLSRRYVVYLIAIAAEGQNLLFVYKVERFLWKGPVFFGVVLNAVKISLEKQQQVFK